MRSSRFATPLLVSICPLLLGLLTGCDEVKVERHGQPETTEQVTVTDPQEQHLQGVIQLTVNGSNRQAVFDAAASRIAWLCRPDSLDHFYPCLMMADGSKPHRLKVDGPCGHLSFDSASRQLLCTLAVGAAATSELPDGPEQDHDLRIPPSKVLGGANWQFDPRYDIYRVALAGSVVSRLTTREGYDGEASSHWNSGLIVYTALEADSCSLYLMRPDGSERRRLLVWSGYAGGARISPDGEQIVFQAARRDGRTGLALYICASDGSELRKLTTKGSYCISPAWHPSGEFIIFSDDSSDQNHELFLIRPDGTRRQRVTYSPGFDAFPVFSRDGKLLLWTSQRGTTGPSRAQIFKANWIP